MLLVGHVSLIILALTGHQKQEIRRLLEEGKISGN